MLKKIMTGLGAGISLDMLGAYLNGGTVVHKDNYTKKTTAGRKRSNRKSDSSAFESYGNKLARKIERGVATKINY